MVRGILPLKRGGDKVRYGAARCDAVRHGSAMYGAIGTGLVSQGRDPRIRNGARDPAERAGMIRQGRVRQCLLGQC